jgi:hypothetical protein
VEMVVESVTVGAKNYFKKKEKSVELVSTGS